MNWDKYFIDIADTVRQKSKDPSSKIGAVLVGTSNQIISTGFNGFPIGINEDVSERWERPIKYQYVCHAERNAVSLAARTGVSTLNSTLYIYGFGPPCVPCTECVKVVLQAGVKRIVGYPDKPAPDNWVDDLAFSLALVKEVGIEFVEFGE